MTRVFLPCESEHWEEDKRYFILLSRVKSPNEFRKLVDDHTSILSQQKADTRQVSLSQRLSCLQGLAVFLTEIATDDEKDVFFQTTLPFICRSASCLDVLVPEDGIPFLCQQEGATVSLGCKLIVSLNANAFLCTFPNVHPLGKERYFKPFTFQRFFKIFTCGDKSRQSPQTAKLRCILNYFYRLSAREEEGVPGTITFTRQVVDYDQMPSIQDWRISEYPLCSVSVDNTKVIEDAGSRTLQVDFAAAHIGGGVLGGGRVQEEIRFSICPELLVSMLIMDAMDPNEAIIINGFERFAYYEGYAATLKFGGNFEDPSERDVYGNLNTSLVAINAVNFQGKFKPEEQYHEGMVLRELNKAFVGFLCKDERGDLIMDQVALRQGEYEEMEPELNLTETGSQVTDPDEEEEEGLLDESGLTEYVTMLSSDILTGAMKDLSTVEEDDKNVIDSYASDLVSDIFSSVKTSLVQDHLPAGTNRTTVQTCATSTSELPEEPSSRSSNCTGQPMLPIEFVESVVEDAVKSGVKESMENPSSPLATVSVQPAVIDALAEQLTTNVLEGITTQSSKKTKVEKSSTGLSTGRKGGTHKGGPVQKIKSHSRQLSGGRHLKPLSMTDGSDLLDPMSLHPPSSRMSIAWSTTSTRDDDSLPPSPTELDNLALRMVGTIDEFSSMLADIVLRDAIALAKQPEDLGPHLDSHKDETCEDKGLSKIDTFLHSLREAGSQYSLDIVNEGLLPFSPRWHNIQKTVLRPVATGNWGCGAFKGDPQLKALLQWMAVSSCGRPELKYYPFKDARVEQLTEVVNKITAASTTVGQLCCLILDYCSKRITGDVRETLFDYLLKN